MREKQVELEEDNMLKIVNDGRKLALDQRLINPDLPDDPSSKVNICVKNVLEVYEASKEQRSTQMIFCDQSTPSKKFNVYDDIREKLIMAGVKPDEIAFIQNAKNEKEKDALFEKVRKGEVRILLGSTVMMGTGTNVQDKLIALHDLDVPWRPSDLEQRSGGIIRQGNENKHVLNEDANSANRDEENLLTFLTKVFPKIQLPKPFSKHRRRFRLRKTFSTW